MNHSSSNRSRVMCLLALAQSQEKCITICQGSVIILTFVALCCLYFVFSFKGYTFLHIRTNSYLFEATKLAGYPIYSFYLHIFFASIRTSSQPQVVEETKHVGNHTNAIVEKKGHVIIEH